MTGTPAAPEAIAALIEARHGDPFALLGPHGGLLRAFLPGAEEAWAVAGDVLHPLTLRHPAGFFEGPAPPGPYRLRARRGSETWEEEDPYRFGPTLGPLDDHLLIEGTHRRLADRLGAHPVRHEGVAGWRFAVWAPRAERVSVVGDFNGWDGRRHPMRKRIDSGIWEIFLPGLSPGQRYKYEIRGRGGVLLPLKADPFARAMELRPGTASLLAAPDGHRWQDEEWMASRSTRQGKGQPISIYEVHATSWKRHPDGRFWNWDELAADLIPHARGLGFTHIELLPVMEHPLDASWGYQPIGLFAPTARLGDAAGLKRFIDAAHRAGLGVILDWVPAHFPKDAHGLAWFDGAPLYEHPDPRRGEHPQWGSAVYDYGRREVQAFLIASALYWLQEFHADGLRVDAVSSMIRLDFARRPGEWEPGPDGSAENADAVAFLRHLTSAVRAEVPDALLIAEESTDRFGITRPPAEGGLGFHLKWNMGWMNDTLRYMAKDPIHRRWHHGLMNFGIMYAWSEAFILPLSHDEVVHGKGSLLGRMPDTGTDDWQRFANLRAYYAFMWAHPGRKLLFMGGEIGQWREWSEERELDWWLLTWPRHQGLAALIADLNTLYRGEAALHARDDDPAGFRWIDADDAEHSTFSWLRFGPEGSRPVAVLCNFTPVPRPGHIIGLSQPGPWRVLLNTDDIRYGGSGVDPGPVLAEACPSHGLPARASLMLPPLAAVFLAPDPAGRQGGEGDAAA
ncbi:MAG: 1,4-alpha-glucan branching protein GlgB [Rhodovarius sp.]|nr:1,4-alpha-glucan branching protein GlgB [Rhodovarius sp.]